MKKIKVVITISILCVGISLLALKSEKESKKSAMAQEKRDSLAAVDSITKAVKIASVDKFYTKKIDSLNYIINTLSLKQYSLKRKCDSLEKKALVIRPRQNYYDNDDQTELLMKAQTVSSKILDIMFKKQDYQNKIDVLTEQKDSSISKISSSK